jgi:signal transduction histidine kinase
MDTVAATRERVLAAASDGERLEALVQLASSLFEYDASEAVQVADEAISLGRAQSDWLAVAWARLHRSWALSSLGRPDEALTEQMAVLADFEQCGDKRGIGHALMAIGDLHGEAGDTSTALEYLDRASGPLESAGDEVGRGVVLNLTGIVLSHEQRHAEAAALFGQAEDVFRRLDDPLRVPMTKLNRGFELLAMATGPLENHTDLISSAERIANEVIVSGVAMGEGGRSTVAHGRSLLARAYAARGECGAALSEAELAEHMAMTGGFDTLAVEVGLDRTAWLTEAGRDDEARELLEKLSAISSGTDNRRALARVSELRAGLLERLGDHQGALLAFREFHRLDGELHTDEAERRSRLTSARLQVEGARREAELARQRVAELEALDHDKRDFLASVSHELRTPLAAVLGFATELAEAWDRFDPEEARTLVALIARQSADISSIVDDLLTITRVEAGTMSVHLSAVDVVEQVQGTVQSLGREAGCSVDFQGEAVVWADPTRLRQIVRNLVTNAFRYGGPRVQVSVKDFAGLVAIEVRDSGGPIPASRVLTMFDPFDRGDGGRTPNSVGLGLAVARSLARMMEGELVYAYEDSESVFRLTLQPPPR